MNGLTRPNFRMTARIILISVLIVLASHSLTWLAGKINVLDALEHSILDFDFTDIYYSSGFSKPHALDSKIVLVNIGDLPREEIVKQIEIINTYNPKILAVHVFFNNSNDSIDFFSLQEALKETNNIVLLNLLQPDRQEPPFDSLMYSGNGKLSERASFGYENLNIPTDDPGGGTVRSFVSRANVGGEMYYPFAAVIAKQVDSKSFEKYVKRNNSEEIINFVGHRYSPSEEDNELLRHFTSFDTYNILNEEFTEDLIKDKIVIMGYLGKDLFDQSPFKKSYTPLNPRYLGRSLPDMYALEIHANILNMILTGQYIDHYVYLERLLDIIILILIVWFCHYLYNMSEENYPVTSKVAAFICINVMVVVPLVVFHFYAVKIDLRYGIFYLIFAPDLFEVLYPKIKRKWKLLEE